MTMNDPSMETGIVALATMVDDAVPRNKKMTSTTRQMVMTRVWLTSAMDSRTKSASSATLPKETPGGMESRNDTMTAFTLSATSTVLAPGCLRTARITLRRPLIQNRLLSFLELLKTFATWLRRIGEPSR